MKTTVKLVSLVLLAASLVACGGGSSKADADAAAAPAAAALPAAANSDAPSTAPAANTTPPPAASSSLPTYGPPVQTIGGVNYCKRPMTDAEWGPFHGTRPDSERGNYYALSPCTS